MSEFSVILAAAGKSSRFQAEPGVRATKKVFADLAGQPVWSHAASKFKKNELVQQLIIVVSPEDMQWFAAQYEMLVNELGISLVEGGTERADSVQSGLAHVDGEYVAIHDAARACITAAEIQASFDAALKYDAAILAAPCSATLKYAPQQQIESTIPRKDVWLAQTPQTFRTELLRSAYESHPDPSTATDEASLVESLGHEIRVVAGESTNLKITTPQDLQLAHAILAMQRGTKH